MNHPLRNFQRGPTWSSNNDPLVTSNRIMDDFQFLPGRGMKSIVDRDSGTIGILECCSITAGRRRYFAPLSAPQLAAVDYRLRLRTFICVDPWTIGRLLRRRAR